MSSAQERDEPMPMRLVMRQSVHYCTIHVTSQNVHTKLKTYAIVSTSIPHKAVSMHPSPLATTISELYIYSVKLE